MGSAQNKSIAMPGEISETPRRARRGSGERTRPRVQFPASRRKTLFGEAPNTTRRDAYAPQTARHCHHFGYSLPAFALR